jgi:TrmH family RNA methyltransferase
MTATVLSRVCVVLYEPQDHVNIAATVRAMRNMGVECLRLVRPVQYDPYRLEGIAHGAAAFIEQIQIFETFDDAVVDCVYAVGFTARRRAAKWPIIDPKRAAAELLERAADAPVAIVFGREDNGLPNEVLDRLHAAVTIPTTEHSSLNLAQAVLIGLYELHLAAGDATRTLPPPRKATPPPPTAELEQFFTDAERALTAIDFFKTRNSEHIMRSVRSMTVRAGPDSRELSLARSIALEVLNFLARTRRDNRRT